MQFLPGEPLPESIMSAITLLRPRHTASALLSLAATLMLGGGVTAQPHPSTQLPALKMFRPIKSAVPANSSTRTGIPGAMPTTATVKVTLSFPGVPDTAFAAIRGPDGEVRYFPIEGGRKELGTRVIIVRPGERIHIQLPPAKPR